MSVDWNDLEARAAYRREATRVARPLRIAGLTLALGAVMLAIVRARWPALPEAVVWAVAGAALLHLLAAISVRLRRPRSATRLSS